MDTWPPLALSLVAVLGLMTLIWLASLVKRDASIIDLFWGIGFALSAWVYFAGVEIRTLRGSLVAGLVTVWGLRLSLYLLWRNWGQGEDYRYQEMRARHPASFPLRSLLTVFWLQGLLLWAISTPLYQAQRPSPFPSLGALDFLGLGLFLVGLGFEAGGDWQLARFKRDPRNAGRVMDQGLWRYTRHPNYFGDALVWWGFFALAAATPGGSWTVYSPLLMTVLLLRVSGVSLLEQRLRETKPEYRAYAERTNAFLPWFPRQRG
jgi:steroid 5-alpha reductase family enzyme